MVWAAEVCFVGCIISLSIPLVVRAEDKHGDHFLGDETFLAASESHHARWLFANELLHDGVNKSTWVLQSLGASVFWGVPNVPKFVHGVYHVLQGKQEFQQVWRTSVMSRPGVVVPRLADLTDEERWLRNEYYRRLIAWTIAAYFALGVGATAFLNRLHGKATQDHGASFQPLVAQGFPDQHSAAGWLKSWLRAPFSMATIVGVYLGTQSALLVFISLRGGVSNSVGVAWEFWVWWIHQGMAVSLLELCIASYDQGPLQYLAFPKRVTMAHLPLLSEKVDTIKDLIFIAVVATDGDELAFCWALAVLCFVGLLASQMWFAFDWDTRGDLLDSYLPLLSSDSRIVEQISEVADETANGFLAKTLQTAKKSCKSLKPVLLKQTSPGRLKIALAEDIPQGVAMLLFASWKGGSTFVNVSAVFCILRLAIASPCIGSRIHESMLESLIQEREVFLKAGNAAKVLSISLMIWNVKGKDSPAPQLKDVGFSSQELLKEGLSTKQLKDAGFTPEELKQAGVTAAELIKAGFELADLKNVAFSAVELKAAGSSALELKDNGFSAAALKEAEFSVAELKEARFSAKELKALGFGMAGLREARFSLAELKDAEFSAAELKEAGSSAAELKGVGFSAAVLKEVGFSLAQLKEIGFNLALLKAAGFGASALKNTGSSAGDLRRGGFTATNLKQAGFSLAELKDAGFSLREMKHQAGFTAGELRRAGSSAVELKDGGFNPAELKEVGFSLVDLKDTGFSSKELKIAGFSASVLKETGFSSAELLVAGFSSFQLNCAGFSAAELKQGGSSAAELKEAGFSAKVLNEEGFNLAELIQLEFSAAELHEAGLRLEELIEAGFSGADLKGLGFSLVEMRKAGFPRSWEELNPDLGEAGRGLPAVGCRAGGAGFSLVELKQAGFSAADLKDARFSEADLKKASFSEAELKVAGFR